MKSPVCGIRLHVVDNGLKMCKISAVVLIEQDDRPTGSIRPLYSALACHSLGPGFQSMVDRSLGLKNIFDIVCCCCCCCFMKDTRSTIMTDWRGLRYRVIMCYLLFCERGRLPGW